jgi:hypothetical protein
MRASWFRMGVRRSSRPLWGVGVIAMPNVRLDTTRCVHVPPGAGVVWLLVTSLAVGVFIDCHWVADRVEVTRWVISSMWELFSEDEGMEFWSWIVEATELPPWEESLSPAGTKMRALAGESWEFPEGPRIFCPSQLPRVRTFRTTRVLFSRGLWEGIVR